MLEISLRRIQEITRDAIVLGLTVCDLSDRIAVQAEENRARVAEDDGGVRRNEELGVSGPLELMDDPEERQLPLRRERGLWLIEDVDSLLEPIRKQRQEGLTVGLLVQ